MSSSLTSRQARLHSRLPPTKLLFQWQLHTWCFTAFVGCCCSPFCWVLFSSMEKKELSGSRSVLWKLKQNEGGTVSIEKKWSQKEWTYFNPSSAYSIRSLVSKSPFLTVMECLCSGHLEGHPYKHFHSTSLKNEDPKCTRGQSNVAVYSYQWLFIPATLALHF